MNWGNKLLLTFIVFASGMGYLVYRSMNVNFELVEKEYYKSELRYQQVIDGTNRVNELTSLVTVEQTSDGFVLQLPTEMKDKTIAGDIWFYCAYDEKKDKRMPLRLDVNAAQHFQPTFISPGKYTVKISWTSDNRNFYAEKLLTVI